MREHSIDEARTVLSYITAARPREDWVPILMGTKHQFGDAGKDIARDWSATDAEGFDPKDFEATWRSIKADGGITFATVIAEAKKNGYQPPKPDRQAKPPSAAQLAKQKAEQAERERLRRLQEQEQHENAANEARDLWDAASEAGAADHAYLKRKGVGAYGVRVAADGRLLVPLRDGDGELLNVQRIAPDKPEKMFLKGSRVSGLWHMLGSINGADVLLMAEGYATAASLHAATERPVAVAFNAGNLKHVAKALRKAMPGVLIAVCGDDDRAKAIDARRKNTGADAARAAAASVHGTVILPHGLPTGATDWNDLHMARGLDDVRAQVEAAIMAALNSRSTRRSMAPDEAVPLREKPNASAPTDRFTVTDHGLFYRAPGDDDAPPRRICDYLRVIALACDIQGNQAALLLEFKTKFGDTRRWLMPMEMLAGDGTAYRGALLRQGFSTPPDPKRRALLTEYLQSRSPDDRVIHVSRVGWHGRCYVLPHETLGTPTDGDRIVFFSEAGVEVNFNQRGTLDQWKNDLSRLCVGNSRLAFMVALALAGPMLAFAPGVTGGGFLLVGDTSIGKSTAMALGAGVWGKAAESEVGSFIQKLRSTSNGMEFVAEQHNDCTMFLDELGMMDGAELSAVIYMLADGSGKSRSRAAGGLRPRPTWRSLFGVSGEVTAQQQIEASGKRMKGGQEVRLIPVSAAVTPGSLTETAHEFGSGHELSVWIKQRAARVYGVAGRAWLEYLVAHFDQLAPELRRRMPEIEGAMVPDSAAGQVKRGGRRFALVAAAGEMATAAGITGWPAGEAMRAARKCFEAWLVTRGGAGASEESAMLRQVRKFIEEHGASRFAWTHKTLTAGSDKTIRRAGFLRLVSRNGKPVEAKSEWAVEAFNGDARSEYLVLSGTFQSEVCAGFDHTSVARVLLEHDYLIASEKGRYNVSMHIPGEGNVRCYRIQPAIMDLDL